MTAGQPADLILWGTGLDSDGAAYEVRVLGSGITVRADSVRLDPQITINESHPLRVTVDVAEGAGRIASVVVWKDSAPAALSGSLLY